MNAPLRILRGFQFWKARSGSAHELQWNFLPAKARQEFLSAPVRFVYL
jgi:hypothetical protein